ncbi:MAG: FAD:protein FMN transferase [Proteobacteria bacterium]|nr:FAD:protein FMN transferase [Pseudomonadota bacterium]
MNNGNGAIVTVLQYYEFDFEAMASDCQLKFYAPSAALAEQVTQSAIHEVRRIEARYSRYQKDSVLSQINAQLALGNSVKLDSETEALLLVALQAYRLSDGLFDISSGVLAKAWSFADDVLPTEAVLTPLLLRIGVKHFLLENGVLIPKQSAMSLDFGGLGKEYAVDRVACIFEEQGIKHGLISLGGDIRVVGPHVDDSPWIIAIKDPRHEALAMCHLMLKRGAIATSGDYERYKIVAGQRYCHILNPNTGWPVSSVRVVSVLTDYCLAAGVLSTIAMLKEHDAVTWLKQRQCDYILEEATGQRSESAGLVCIKRSG